MPVTKIIRIMNQEGSGWPKGGRPWLLSLEEEEREKGLSCRKLGEGTSRPSSKPADPPGHFILVEFTRGLAGNV